jgi:biotin carboxyl carrier protein
VKNTLALPENVPERTTAFDPIYVINSPMVGLFTRHREFGHRKLSALSILEAMKVMNEVRSSRRSGL